jgi:FlaA1/EpsC-like NDP-sugar epimerase
VTGGSGTVGSRLVEHLLARGPEVVRILGRDETKQFYQQIAFRGRPDVRLLIGDVRDRDRLMRAFEGIDTVFIALR